ncbi:hypothetical protein Mapa_015808 [Marchantia paleacea]|nr:hypothetical protein Mapa_015808 [Marchantia paleacea]
MRRRSLSTSSWITQLALLLLSSCCLPSSGQSGTGSPEGDVAALRSITTAFHMTSQWTGAPCDSPPWLGVSCNAKTHRVARIDLNAEGISGFIPTTIKDLTALEYLDLSNNNFSGPIPNELASISSLLTLSLDNNNFCGRIPDGLLSNRSTFSWSGNPSLCEPGVLCDTAGCIAQADRSATPPSSENSAGMSLIIGAVIGGLVVLGLLGGLFTCFYLRSRKRKTRTISLPLVDYKQAEAKAAKENLSFSPSRSDDFQNTTPSPFLQPVESYTSATLSQAAGYISKQEIVTATNNFSKQIGEGGYGPVYWGVLANGKEVAVKVNKILDQGTQEFVNEVGLLTRVHHRNLVTLLCFCECRDERFLVYEYQARGTLSDLLCGKKAEEHPLDWPTRLDIALNAAKGLEYLHTGCNPKIIHRDVKSNNILIDSNFVAKVADFGISKAAPDNDGTNAFSTLVRGTPGYVDPEYVVSQKLSTKSDVYSFGIVLMELIAGCRPYGQNKDGTMFNITMMVREALAMGNILSIADPALKKVKEFNPESMWRVADIAFSSADREGNKRPDMTQVVRGLTEAIELERSYDPNAPPDALSYRRTTTFNMASR